MHVDGARGHVAAVVHLVDADVGGHGPHAGVRGDVHAEVAGDLEGRLLREALDAGQVEGDLEAEHVALAVDPAGVEVAELRSRRPLPRASEDVAVAEDEPPGYRLERVHRRVGVLGGPQAVRPVDAGGHAGVDRLDGGEQVARVVVLGAEDLAPLQVVVDEVLGERPVGAVAAHRRLPHVPVRVDHAGHDDAASRVDLRGALGHRKARADRGDPSRRRPARRRWSRTVCASSIVSTVAFLKTTGWPGCGAVMGNLHGEGARHERSTDVRPLVGHQKLHRNTVPLLSRCQVP